MAVTGKMILCPYCGNVQRAATVDRCERCGGYFDELSRRVSQQHMGPWFIHDKGRPFRPGCSFEVIARQIQRGKIEPNTIMRGPTTKQFWSVARNVPGVAHLLGYCFNCGEHVLPTATECPKCRAQFSTPDIRDQLGLDPYDPKVLEMAAAFVAQQAAAGTSSASSIFPPARASVVAQSSVALPPLPPARATVVSTKLQSPAPLDASSALSSLSIPAVATQTAWMDSGFDGAADTFTEPLTPSRSNNTVIWILLLINGLLALAITVYLVFSNSSE